MAYSKEEWEWIKTHLVEDVTYTHLSYYGGESTTGRVQKNGKVQFNHPDFVMAWDIQQYGHPNKGLMIDFKWPDGSPMIPFVEHDGKPYNPVLAKIASLDARFKAKSLPKCTQKALPLPA